MNSQAHPNLERSFQDSKPQDRSNNNTFFVLAVKLFFAWLSPDKGEGGGGGGAGNTETSIPPFHYLPCSLRVQCCPIKIFEINPILCM